MNKRSDSGYIDVLGDELKAFSRILIPYKIKDRIMMIKNCR